MGQVSLIITAGLLLLGRYEQILTTANASRVEMIVPVVRTVTFINSSNPGATNQWNTNPRGLSSLGYNACKSAASDEVDSLLVIGYISTAPANEITINVTYKLACCKPCISWQHSIGLYAFMSSRELSVIPNPNTASYAYVGELRNGSVMQGATKKAFNSYKTIEMKGFRGIYLGFRDKGVCGAIGSISIQYNMCSDSKVQLLMRSPTAVALNTSTVMVYMNRNCVAHLKPGNGANAMLCDADGRAKIQGGCQCLAGFQNLSSSQCIECPRKTFKDTSGNFQCKVCGANVVDGKLPRTSLCECIPGFYRPTNRKSIYYVNCEEPPSAPRNLYVTDILSNSALLKWKNPEKLGTGDDLAYEIRYGYNVHRTRHWYLSPTGLKRLTYYSATVVAVNNVTYAINKRNGVTVYFKTKSGLPSAVVSLEIKRNVDHSVTVYWQEPKRKEGNDLRYFVTINNDAGRFTRIQKYTINQKKERMKYIVSVKAHTVVGFSDERNISFEIEGENSIIESEGMALEVGIGCSLLAAQIIVILTYSVLYIRDKIKKNVMENARTIPLADFRSTHIFNK